MIKYLLVGISFLCLFNLAAYANPQSEKSSGHKEELGLGLGAIIGGLIGGPPGAIIGAAGGAWYGGKQEIKDDNIVSLEKKLAEKQAELAGLQGEFAGLESRYGTELQKVKLDNRVSDLEKLIHGVSFSVYFRTNSAAIDSELLPRIQHLAGYLQSIPEIQIHLEAHADQRGTDDYNKRLSQLRADSVKQALITAGIKANRINSFAHGESMARGSAGDIEGYTFDRRVNIQLSLDEQTYAVNR